MASLCVYGWDGVNCMRSFPLTNSSDESVAIATTATENEVLILKLIDNTRTIEYHTRDNSLYMPCLLNVLKGCMVTVSADENLVMGSGDSIAACATNREIYIIAAHQKDPQCLADESCLKPRIFDNPLQAPVRKLACGSNHCLILSAYRCFAYGSNEFGQLGIDTQSAHEDRLREVLLPDCNKGIQDIAAGSNHSAIVSAHYGYVYTFGNGSYFKLGHGRDTHCLAPTRVVELEDVGEFRMDGSTAGVAFVACGAWHTVVVTKGTNDVYGWGWNNFGNIGRNPLQRSAKNKQASTDGSTKSDSVPSHVSEIITFPRRIEELDSVYLLGDGGAVLGEGYGTVCALSCGSRHTALRTMDGRVIVMGQLGPARIPSLDLKGALLPEGILGIRHHTTRQQLSGHKRTLAGSEHSSAGGSKISTLYDWHLQDTHARVLSGSKFSTSSSTATVLDAVSAGRSLYCIVE